MAEESKQDLIEDTQAIDLTKVDWNVLQPNEFHSLEKQMLEQQKLLKKSKGRKQKETSTIVLKLRGNEYIVKSSLAERLRTMRSEKSKEKLIDEIILTSQKVETI